jgi:ribonuclease Z
MVANIHVSLRPPGPLQLDPTAPDDRFHIALAQSQPLPATTAAAFAEAKQAVSRHPVVKVERPSGVKILPLGTGSAVPNKYRNGEWIFLLDRPH